MWSHDVSVMILMFIIASISGCLAVWRQCHKPMCLSASLQALLRCWQAGLVISCRTCARLQEAPHRDRGSHPGLSGCPVTGSLQACS
jgi:hypothetical protein